MLLDCCGETTCTSLCLFHKWNTNQSPNQFLRRKRHIHGEGLEKAQILLPVGNEQVLVSTEESGAQHHTGQTVCIGSAIHRTSRGTGVIMGTRTCVRGGNSSASIGTGAGLLGLLGLEILVEVRHGAEGGSGHSDAQCLRDGDQLLGRTTGTRQGIKTNHLYSRSY